MSVPDQIVQFLKETEPVYNEQRLERIKASNKFLTGPPREFFGGNKAELSALSATETELSSAYDFIKMTRDILESVAALLTSDENLLAAREAVNESLRMCLESRDLRIEHLERELARRV